MKNFFLVEYTDIANTTTHFLVSGEYNIDYTYNNFINFMHHNKSCKLGNIREADLDLVFANNDTCLLSVKVSEISETCEILPKKFLVTNTTTNQKHHARSWQDVLDFMKRSSPNQTYIIEQLNS